MKRTEAKRNSGFSRLDLLAAVVVLALMIAVAGQGITSGAEQSARMACVENARKIMRGTLLFAADNNDGLPRPGWGISHADPSWLHGGALNYQAPYAERLAEQTSKLRSGQIWQYLQRPDWYKCPLDRAYSVANGRRESYTNRYVLINSYVMNGAVSGYGREGDRTFNLSRFKPDDAAFWELTDVAPVFYNDSSAYPGEGPGDRHNELSPLACFDGRVEWITTKAFYSLASPQRVNRLWCDPAGL